MVSSTTTQIAGFIPIMPVNARDMAGTSRDKQGQGRDKQGQTGTAPVCPCLSLHVSTFAIPAFFLLQMISTVFIGMNIVTLTLLAKATVSMHAKLMFNFFSVLYF